MNKYIKIFGGIITLLLTIYITNKIVSASFNDGANSIIRNISIKNDLKRSTEKFKERLPLKIDDNTTLLKMEYMESQNKLVSTYQVEGISNEEALSELKDLKNRMLELIKNDPNGRNALDAQASFEYNYIDISGNTIQSILITPKDF